MTASHCLAQHCLSKSAGMLTGPDWGRVRSHPFTWKPNRGKELKALLGCGLSPATGPSHCPTPDPGLLWEGGVSGPA